MLKNRAGFTLTEVMIALTVTAVIGAAVTGVFISQSRFYDHQEKVGAARAVSRGALNIMMSEMRMVDQLTGIAAASNTRLDLRVPYAFGMVCKADGTGMTISLMPVDAQVLAEGGQSGVAIRDGSGMYAYVGGTNAPTDVADTECTNEDIAVVPPTSGALASSAGRAVSLTIGLTSPPVKGTPVFLYKRIAYEFKPSVLVPGSRLALWREMQDATAPANAPEELVAPFDATAQFRFFVNDAQTAQTAVPASLNTVTGIEIILDAISERPNADGTHQSVPLTTAVHFKNR